MRILGVDPGSVSGAYAIISPTGAWVGDLPGVDRQVDAAEFARLVTGLEPDMAVVELVGARPGQGVTSMFRFGRATGLIEGVILGLGVPLVTPTPQRWKRYFRLTSDGEKSRALAIQRFPKVTGLARIKDHNRAEALLMALWLRETGGNSASP